MTEQSCEIRTVTSEIGKLLYGFPLLDNSRFHGFEGSPPFIFACIGFNFKSTSNEKQKVILESF